MDEVSMNDGLDAPETIAFGLGAAETATLVVSLLMAYALTRSAMPAAIAWLLAALLALAGAALAWGRVAERSFLVWALLLCAHCVRRRGEMAATVERAGRVVMATLGGLERGARAGLRVGVLVRAGRSRAASAATSRATPTLRLLQPGPPAPGREVADRDVSSRTPRHRAAWRVGLCSLRGGAGRTTIACEVAAVLAARGHAGGTGGMRRPLRVTLIDACSDLPMSAVRLGLPLPLQRPSEHRVGGGRDGNTQPIARHWSGLDLACRVPGTRLSGKADEGELGLLELIDHVEARGADVVVLDLPPATDVGHLAVLAACDQVGVVITPTAGGVVDCYRSTAQLRRLGLRDRLVHIVNRSTPGFACDELVGDLGITELVTIPEDPALWQGESSHTICALEGAAPAATALCGLAATINARLLGGGAERSSGMEAVGARAG